MAESPRLVSFQPLEFALPYSDLSEVRVGGPDCGRPPGGNLGLNDLIPIDDALVSLDIESSGGDLLDPVTVKKAEDAALQARDWVKSQYQSRIALT